MFLFIAMSTACTRNVRDFLDFESFKHQSSILLDFSRIIARITGTCTTNPLLV